MSEIHPLMFLMDGPQLPWERVEYDGGVRDYRPQYLERGRVEGLACPSERGEVASGTAYALLHNHVDDLDGKTVELGCDHSDVSHIQEALLSGEQA